MGGAEQVLVLALDVTVRGFNPLRLHRSLRYYSGMSKEQPKPGPEADRLKLKGDWRGRLAEAVMKAKPEGGWPKPEKKAKKKAPKG